MTKQSQHVLVVIGPTASGKSDFAVDLALEHNGEIISADSRQVYKSLDIGTGKISPSEMRGVTHHMVSVYEPDEELSVARFARDALPILNDILSRNKTPIICGGTGQYVDALIYETLIPNVKPNKTLRETLEKKSTEELVTILTSKDKRRLETIDIHNRVRLIRALEIIDSLGSVPEQGAPTLRHLTHIYIMNPSRELLRMRITRRLEKRLKDGMIEEVEVIMKKGYTSDMMKKFGLEYAIIGKYLEGTLTLEAMKEELIKKSMHYAKRQQTWNKKYLSSAEIIDVQD
jgi:tRNA dimethylallyltransferase